MAGSFDLTERDLFWLNHLRACERSGADMSAHAAAEGLQLKSFYSAKSRLVQKGAVPSLGAGDEISLHRVVVAGDRASGAGGDTSPDCGSACNIDPLAGVIGVQN